MKKILFSLLGIILFLYIVISIGFDAIVQSFASLDLQLFALALLVLVPSLALKGLKQRRLISPFKAKTSLVENTKIWLVGFFFGTASPAKSGDAVRALYMRNLGISLGEGLAAVFLERVLDLVVLFALAFIGLFMLTLPQEVGSGLLLPIVTFFIVFIVALIAILKKELTRFLLRPFFNMFAPEKFKQSIKQGFDQFYLAMQRYPERKANSFAVVLLTLLSWLIVFYQFHLLALALSIDISFISLALVLPIILLVEALPISLGGLGTREAAAIIMLGLLGIGAASAVSFSLTILLFNLIQAAMGFALFNSMEKPI